MAAEAIEERLEAADHSSLPNALALRLFRGQFALLHDLDPQRSRRLAARLQQRSCHPAIASALKNISSFRREGYAIERFRHVEIFFSRSLRYLDFSKSNLFHWLERFPADHLTGLECIFVMPPGGCGSDASGTYNMPFGLICIAWDEDLKPGDLLTRIGGFILLPKTFCHEMGHHVLGHNLGPRDSVREKAADFYADGMLIELYPRLMGVGRTLAFILYLFRRNRVTKRNCQRKVQEFWKRQGLKPRATASELELSTLERSQSLMIPEPLRRLLLLADGMESNVFCRDGYRFFGHRELEVIEKGPGDHKPLVVFAEHLPTGIRYAISSREDRKKEFPVYRSGCRTESGHLRIAYSFRQFLAIYMKNRPILYA